MISIITGWGKTLGTGHIQRMTALAEFLYRKKKLRCGINCCRAPGLLPASTRHFFHTSGDVTGGWILRDKRDSTVEEISSLKKRGRVIVIDDCGEGRTAADACIDLLPNLKFNQQEKQSFIYGYNFIEALRKSDKPKINKNIDVAVYAGYDPSVETIQALRSLLPPRSTCVILSGKNQVLLQNDVEKRLKRTYAEILAASKVLISHFGISLYEGFIARCRLVTANPTEYHSQLADKVSIDLGVSNIGILNSADRVRTRELISHFILSPLAEAVSPEKILEKTSKCLENFYSLLLSIMNH